jgi:hypothetical protein
MRTARRGRPYSPKETGAASTNLRLVALVRAALGGGQLLHSPCSAGATSCHRQARSGFDCSWCWPDWPPAEPASPQGRRPGRRAGEHAVQAGEEKDADDRLVEHTSWIEPSPVGEQAPMGADQHAKAHRIHEAHLVKVNHQLSAASVDRLVQAVTQRWLTGEVDLAGDGAATSTVDAVRLPIHRLSEDKDLSLGTTVASLTDLRDYRRCRVGPLILRSRTTADRVPNLAEQDRNRARTRRGNTLGGLSKARRADSTLRILCNLGQAEAKTVGVRAARGGLPARRDRSCRRGGPGEGRQGHRGDQGHDDQRLMALPPLMALRLGHPSPINLRPYAARLLPVNRARSVVP